MPDIVAAADIGVAPYDPARLRQLALGFYWSPLKIFEYMASGLPTVTIPRAPLTDIVREGQEGLHAREGDPAALAAALVAPGRRCRAAPPARRERARARGREVLVGPSLRAARAGAAEDRRVRVVLATEVYPPRAGGAGWSTRALALGLREAGHDVTVLTTSPGPEDLDGLRVRRLSASGAAGACPSRA